jgi:hypothetical protein
LLLLDALCSLLAAAGSLAGSLLQGRWWLGAARAALAGWHTAAIRGTLRLLLMRRLTLRVTLLACCCLRA